MALAGQGPNELPLPDSQATTSTASTTFTIQLQAISPTGPIEAETGRAVPVEIVQRRLQEWTHSRPSFSGDGRVERIITQ